MLDTIADTAPRPAWQVLPPPSPHHPPAVTLAPTSTGGLGIAVLFTSGDDLGRIDRVTRLGSDGLADGIRDRLADADEVRRYMSIQDQLETARRSRDAWHAEAEAHKASRRLLELGAADGLAARLQESDAKQAEARKRGDAAAKDAETLAPLLKGARRDAETVIAAATGPIQSQRVRALTGRMIELFVALTAAAPSGVLDELADVMLAARVLESNEVSIERIVINKLLGRPDGAAPADGPGERRRF